MCQLDFVHVTPTMSVQFGSRRTAEGQQGPVLQDIAVEKPGVIDQYLYASMAMQR
jgi:hypothetical protein